MESVFEFACRQLSIAACAYYHFGQTIMDDGDYDELALFITHNYDRIPLYYQEVFGSASDLLATSHHIYVSAQCYNATLRALRDMGIDHELCASPFKGSAEYENADGTTFEIMTFGG